MDYAFLMLTKLKCQMGLPNLLALTRKPTLYHSFKKSNNYGGAIAWDLQKFTKMDSESSPNVKELLNCILEVKCISNGLVFSF